MDTKKKYNFLYKTTNNINGKVYVGVHSTNKLKDGYIGCGVTSQKNAERRIKRDKNSAFIKAVVKYGYNNFTTKPLAFFSTAEDAYEVEELIVDEEFVRSDKTYNTALGGGYPFKVVDSTPKQIKQIKNMYVFNKTLKEISLHLGVSERMVRRALKGFRNSPRYQVVRLRLKFKAQLYNIKQSYEEGAGSVFLFNKFKIGWAALQLFIKFYGWQRKKQEWVGLFEGKIIAIQDLVKFGKENNLHSSGINSQIKGDISSYKGWRFVKKEDYESGNFTLKEKISDKHKGLKFINPSGEVEEVTTNLSDFCISRGLQPTNIYQLWSGKMKQHKGYKLYDKAKIV